MNLPATMQVVAIGAPGGPDVLQPGERPVPQPGAGEVLIKVAAAGVNGPDLMQRKGLYPAPPGASDLPGLEVSGEVVAVGAGAQRWSVGDKVTALTKGGGYAEYCAVDARHCLPVPRQACPKPFSRCGAISSSARVSRPAKRSWCTAARAASERRPYSSPRRSARR
jgi:NADPH:quinone reductase-like Zn-dependent oxidoreductase